MFCLCGCKNETSKGKRFVRGHNGTKNLPSSILLEAKLCFCGCNQMARPGNKYINGHNGRGITKSIEEINRTNVSRKIHIKKVSQLCACGCGEETKKGNKFIYGHNARVNNPGIKRKFLREIRLCVCHCGDTFECRVDSKQKYLVGHNLRVRNPLEDPLAKAKHKKSLELSHSDPNSTFNSDEYKQKIKIARNNPDRCKKHSAYMTRRWNDPRYASRILNRKPLSYFEQKIIDLIKEYNLPYKFVGNGEIKIGHCIPDFININGEKKVVEVYGSRYKVLNYGSIENYEKGRKEELAKYGYEVIFLNEKDLNPKRWKELCLNKIRG